MAIDHLEYTELESPIGALTLSAVSKGICSLDFGRFQEHRGQLENWSRKRFGTGLWIRTEDNLCLNRAVRQLDEYFARSRRRFDLPLHPEGTPFQKKKVWQALSEIPYGAVRSYKEVGTAIEAPKAVRAVGGANNRNPIPILIPCHRVIGADGSMTGYGGGLPIKQFLLELEAGAFPPQRPSGRLGFNNLIWSVRHEIYEY